MKFQLETSSLPVIKGHGPGWIALGGQRITHSVLIDPAGRPQPWGAAAFEALGAHHFAALALPQESAPAAELVLLGSGARLRFPPPAWLRPLIEAGIGIETMSTPAACRTWNILSSEGRRVLAALVIEPAV
ncbi:MAG: Mth938-like domain-containing protein [Burkholderiaceae bacterium]|nr:Mth938-like domain-containing protein [Burkholderiaceae bacterium]